MPLIRIPNDRIAALIGKGGSTKKEIEERTGAKLDIESTSGEVDIHTDDMEDSVLALKVVDVIKAIGRGFSPQRAFKLYNDEFYLDILDIKKFVGRDSKSIRRVKSRIIGSNGRTRSLMENFSGANITIYGGTIGIIGKLEDLEIARTACEMILNGSEHSTVYKFLEKKRKEKKRAGIEFLP